jgi:hypothetical protein
MHATTIGASAKFFGGGLPPLLSSGSALFKRIFDKPIIIPNLSIPDKIGLVNRRLSIHFHKTLTLYFSIGYR